MTTPRVAPLLDSGEPELLGVGGRGATVPDHDDNVPVERTTGAAAMIAAMTAWLVRSAG